MVAGVVFKVGIIATPQASFTVGVVGAVCASVKQLTILPVSAAGVKFGWFIVMICVSKLALSQLSRIKKVLLTIIGHVPDLVSIYSIFLIPEPPGLSKASPFPSKAFCNFDKSIIAIESL